MTLDPLARPALTYHGSENLDGTHTTYPVDRYVPDDPRERAICRALLQHALNLLDASEPCSATGSSR
ncbi:hypothetical protein [Streptomyces virginiae]|uniref:hypothetical protein n=1 Tax=Streptomyces virginiae TaxID=1961 RepID=UPI0036995B99